MGLFAVVKRSLKVNPKFSVAVCTCVKEVFFSRLNFGLEEEYQDDGARVKNRQKKKFFASLHRDLCGREKKSSPNVHFSFSLFCRKEGRKKGLCARQRETENSGKKGRQLFSPFLEK